MKKKSGWGLVRAASVLGLCGGAFLGLSGLSAPPAHAQSADPGNSIEKEYGVVGRKTPEGQKLNDQLERVTSRITSAVGYRLKSAKLLGGKDAQHDKVVNAFALPDGRIYVTLGLMREVQKSSDPDAELAFVVGHETTHVTRKHGEGQQKAAIGAGIAAILVGVATRNRAAATAANVGSSAYVSHFSRKDEYDADKGGLVAMHKAGYPLDGAVKMLQRLGTVSGAQPNPTLNGWFGSHPLTNNRVKKVQDLIRRINAGESLPAAR